MVEIRKEITKDEWSIIAPTRSERPFDFTEDSRESRGGKGSDCPFCPGNESDTPPEVYGVREGDTSGESDWKVRVFPNKYPALDRDDTSAVIEGDLFESMGGFGYHEVIAETPKHDASLNELGVEEIKLVIETYANRATKLAEEPEIEYVSIFRNQGNRAGASLSHPHSQVIATTFIPDLLKREYREANSFHDRKGRCLYCQLLEKEKSEGDRVILENDGFVAFAPFGSRFPYETHVYPRRHRANFTEIRTDELEQMANTLKETINSMGSIFGDFFPYNYSIHTGYPDGATNHEESYHWHIEIIPRLTTPAGFEWGSGNFINIIEPERAARELREQVD